jgi:hypothetical protein
MLLADKFTTADNSPSRFKARVGLYNSSTLLNTYSEEDYLQGFTVERVGEEGKFFGFGVCHKITVILGDYEKKIDLTGANVLEVEYGVENDYLRAYPYFIIAEITRDEATKEYTITAYDALITAADHTADELTLPTGTTHTIKSYAQACANVLGLPLNAEGVQDTAFNLSCVPAANFEGTESVRDVLNDIAEATQTIYYINNARELVFKRLGGGAAAAIITDGNSMNIIAGETKKLTGITHATELGDNVNVTTGEEGVTQYVRDNAFWELRDDIADILDAALANIAGGDPAQLGEAKLGEAKLGEARLGVTQQSGMTNTVFSAEWFGNVLLEIGDKIEVHTEGGTIYSYLLNDVITYSGIVMEQTLWEYGSGGDEHATPNTLGEAIKQTFARVDKVNKQIELVASESAETRGNMASLLLTTEDLKIAIKQSEIDGAKKVETETGFTFDANGLEVSKTGSEMSTRITEDGMKVYRDNTEVLTADHKGVNAANLHATTYLIIGNNSRFEDYEGTRTACFWIG